MANRGAEIVQSVSGTVDMASAPLPSAGSPPPSSGAPPGGYPPPPQYPGMGYVLVPAQSAPPPKKDHTVLIVVLVVVIVLVVVPTVLAMVLYGLVASQLSSGSTPPGSSATTVNFGAGTTSASPNNAVYFGNATIASLVGTLDTSQFGVTVTNPSFVITSQTAPPVASCGTSTAWTCPAPTSGWYVVLLTPTGTPLATFPSTAGANTWDITGSTAPSVNSGDVVVVVAPGSLSGDTLQLFSTTNRLVAGSTAL